MEIIQLFCGSWEIWPVLIVLYLLISIGWKRVRQREQQP